MKVHNKYKNIGIIYELLITHSLLNTVNNKPDPSIGIIKKHILNENSELIKEYKIYSNIIYNKNINVDNIDSYLDILLESYTKLNIDKLNTEKYNLIRDIKNKFTLNTFLKENIDNYKVLASISILLESKINNKYINPDLLLNSRNIIKMYILENNTKAGEIVKDNNIIFNEINESLSKLNKYQKELFANTISLDKTKFSEYIAESVNFIKSVINIHSNKIEDKTLKIKLNEINNLLNFNYNKLTENNIISLYNYYELIDELEKL